MVVVDAQQPVRRNDAARRHRDRRGRPHHARGLRAGEVGHAPALAYAREGRYPAAIVADVSEARKRSENAVRAARDYAQRLVDTVREPLVVLTADLRVQSANAAFYRAFDVDAVAGRGTRLPDLDSVLLAIEDVTEAVANEAERRRFLFSRIDAGQESLAPAAADLNVILREVNAVLEPLAAQSGIGFTTRVIDAPDSVVLDAPKVRQLLVNRASNAVQFTDEGRVGVTVGQADGELVFAVTDTGMGIAADDVPHLLPAEPVSASPS